MANSEALCRLCSKEKKPLVPILEDNPLKVKEKMWNFLKIKVSPTSALPRQICLDCLTKLNQFNEFFVQIQENQVILQLLFNEKPESSDLPSSEICTQTDVPQTPDESQFYIIEEITNDDESKHSEMRIEDDDEDSTENDKSHFEVIEEVSVKEESRSRRKFDRFDCYVCKEQLPGNYPFVQHFEANHPEKELKYQCYVCSGFVKKYRSFTRHIESHIEKRFACDICDLKFSQKITLISHLTSHSNIKKFECTDCNLSFKQNSSLFKHRKQKHLNDVPSCQLCNRTFVNNETYQQHLRSKHNVDDKNIVCGECNKKFASKSALSYHKMSIHSKVKAVKCEKCQEEFKNQVTLVRHKKNCHKKK